MQSASSQAVIEAAGRFTRGEVPNQQLKFAPTVAEFCAEVRKLDDFRQASSRPRLQSPSIAGRTPPFMVNAERLRAKYAACPVLFTDISHDQFLHLSKTKQIPTGAVWVAGLSTVYGPAPVKVARAA